MKIPTDRLLILYLSSLSLFRIDLSFGLFSFMISPQLLLSSLIIPVFLVNLKLSKYKGPRLNYVILILTLIAYLLFTIFLSYHGNLQIKRYILFVQILVSALALQYLFFNLSKTSQKNVIRDWIKYSINIHLIWITVQVILFYQGFHFYADSWERWNFINPLPHGIGYYVPRLEGGFLDPNVCGYYFSMLFFLSKYYDENQSRNQTLLFLFVVLTLSRSAIAAFVLCYFFYALLLFRPSLKLMLRRALVGVIILSASILTLVITGYGQTLLTALEIRILDKGSTNIHTDLIFMGLTETVSSIKNLLFGNGFASSPYFAYELLESVGNKWKYANFHSEYVSVLFEGGLIGVVLYYCVVGYPFLFKQRSSLALVSIFVLILLQGIFYQQYNFHYYWSVIIIVFCLNEGLVKKKIAKQGVVADS